MLSGQAACGEKGSVKNLLAARLYGVLNYDMAISDTLDRTYVLENGLRRLRRETKVCWDWHVAQVFATSQRRIQNRRPTGLPDEFDAVRWPTSLLQTDADVGW